MRKSLLVLAVCLLSLSAVAQPKGKAPVSTLQPQVNMERTVMPRVNKAPAKIDLAENQRLMGYTSSDDIDMQVGFGQSTSLRLGALLDANMLAAYDGMKVVGIRYALNEALPVTKVAIQEEESTTDAVSKTLTGNCTTGWNTVMFDTPYVIDAKKGFYLAYDVTLSSGYCIDLCNSTNPHEGGFMGYGNLGNAGTAWYVMQSNSGLLGDLCIQAIVEGNFAANAVTPQNFKVFTIGAGKSKDFSVEMANYGSSLSNFDYTLTVGDQTSAEQHVTLTKPLGVGGFYTATIPFTAPATSGIYDVTINVTKVNGEANAAPVTSAKSSVTVVAKEFPRGVVMEEFTGTGCGFCPRGMVGMAKANAAYPDNFIGIGIHQYNTSDPMYTANYARLSFSGAPSCILNRTGSEIDPYYGNSGDIVDDIKAEMEQLPTMGVTVTGAWNADSSQVIVKADIESLVDGTYSIDFVLTGDSLTGSTFRQSNYYSQYSASSVNNDPYLTPYTKGGTYGSSYIAIPFNDVLLASSYNGTRALGGSVALTEGNTASASYTLALPTKAALLNAIKKDKVHAIAIVYNSDGIVNAAKSPVAAYDPAGIETVAGNDGTSSSTVVARYDAAGRKLSAPVRGLNIVKLSNGKTLKTFVK